MQKAKVALVKAGIIQSAGRGRIPAAGHAWLKQQHDAGVRFSDWPKGEVTVTKTKDSEESTVKVIRSAGESSTKIVADLPPYRFTEEEFVAVEIRNGKRVIRSLREACNHCRVSLVVCYCASPSIVAHDGRGSVPVTIERK